MPAKANVQGLSLFAYQLQCISDCQFLGHFGPSSFESVPLLVCGTELDAQLNPWLYLYRNQGTEGTSTIHISQRASTLSVQGHIYSGEGVKRTLHTDSMSGCKLRILKQCMGHCIFFTAEQIQPGFADVSRRAY
jgi:hypothetical protein